MDGASKDEGLPPGFRFHPTDEELITYYLTNKISDCNFTGRAIADVDLNKCEPWDLPGKAKMGEKEWYFFSTRDRKYPTGVRTNRATNAGYWKTTGKDKEIFNGATTELVGMKKTLVFYKGRAPRGEKTNWVMHEYRLHTKFTFKNSKDEWVICRVFQKSSAVGKKFPTRDTRSSHYNLDMAPSILMPSVIHSEPFNHHIGRSYAELAELTRALRANPGMNFHLPSQPNLAAGGFTLSALNLNLGATPVTAVSTPAPVMVPPLLPHLQAVAAGDMPISSAMLPGCILQTTDAIFGSASNVGGQATGARFQQGDPCVDLGGYWPSYYAQAN